VARLVDDLRHDAGPLVGAARRTPQTFLHGDWKLGNLGIDGDRTVLLDWTYPGVGPVAHDLAWYLALNRARLPESKEASIGALRASLERRSIDTGGWWDQQVAICLLGALVQFGWEKALGEKAELGWWCDRAREARRWLS
jgi:thiamine kinase-like enzyme